MEEKKKIPCQNAKVIGLICFCVQINLKKNYDNRRNSRAVIG